MGKVDINKKQKKNALLQTAFDLFRDKGFAKRLSEAKHFSFVSY